MKQANRESRRAAIYVRTSTSEQSTDAQESELRDYLRKRGWELVKVYKDRGVSGAETSRPALDQLMSDCRRRQVDVVLCWKFDRFARSLQQLVSALEEFRRLRIHFVSCTEAIDTSSPSGELVFHIFGAIAQFERALIAERVRSGMREAKRKGVKLGRPPENPLTAAQEQKLRRERTQTGASQRELAKKYGLTLWRVHQICRGEQASV